MHDTGDGDAGEGAGELSGVGHLGAAEGAVGVDLLIGVQLRVVLGDAVEVGALARGLDVPGAERLIDLVVGDDSQPRSRQRLW